MTKDVKVTEVVRNLIDAEYSDDLIAVGVITVSANGDLRVNYAAGPHVRGTLYLGAGVIMRQIEKQTVNT